jgi:type VI protein secretion system component VasK
MITRRVREWPRATAAVSVLAIGLILLGVLVASTGSSSPAHAASPPPVNRGQAAAQAKASPSASAAHATIARLQKSLTQESGQLTAARSALAASRADIQCWQGKARHPRKERAVKCGTGSGT